LNTWRAGWITSPKTVAQSNPQPFLSLVGKVLPVQLAQNADKTSRFRTLARIELVPMADDAKD
jgi:hypothetical protein